MSALTRPGGTAVLRSALTTLSVVFRLLVLGTTGCALDDSDLIVAADSGGVPPVPPLPPEVIAAIDERPIGGASLTSGTSGGGTHADARANGALYLVSTLAELKARAGGDAPAVVLIAEGRYTGAGESKVAQVCKLACDADEPLAEGTVAARECPPGATLLDLAYTEDSLRVGSNKTVIGLGAGAHLLNLSVDLDGSSNVILRNLSIEAVQSGVPSVGNGLSLEPAHHVWLDHLSLRDISRTGLDIVSTWDEENAQALDEEAGYITVSHAHFDGFNSANCSQRSELVFTTNRNPALTITSSWFDGASIRVPNFLGPGTWAHLYNNLWSDVDGRGLAVSCGAAALAQGNVFQATHNALYNSDSGAPTWKFCATGYYGNLYAPVGTTGAEANLLDAASTMNLGGQPATGTGLALPKRIAGTEFELTVPVDSGTRTQAYRVTLAADAASVGAAVQAEAGVGHLF